MEVSIPNINDLWLIGHGHSSVGPGGGVRRLGAGLSAGGALQRHRRAAQWKWLVGWYIWLVDLWLILIL